jgi:hypothetical protein
MNKRILILTYLFHCITINADPQSFFNSYKISGLITTAFMSGVGVGLAQWKESSLERQHAEKLARLPQPPKEYFEELHSKKVALRKLQFQQTNFAKIFHLNEAIFLSHKNQQQPSKSRRIRCYKKIKKLAQGCPEVEMVVKTLEDHDAQCQRNCENSENWNFLRNNRYPCHPIHKAHFELQHVAANEKDRIKTQLDALRKEIKELNAKKAPYKKLAKIERDKDRARIAGFSLGAVGIASLCTLGALQYRR